MANRDNGQEELTSRQKGMVRMRSIMDLGMGIMWIAMGIFFIFIRHFSPDLALRYDDAVIKTFGGICIIYGAFRIYRGVKKNYFRE